MAFPTNKHFQHSGIAAPRMQDLGSHALTRERKNRRPIRRAYQWTPELDEILKSAWARGGGSEALKAIRQYQPTWPSYSITRRATNLRLPRRPSSRRWTPQEVEQMLWAIDSNASLALIAERLGRSTSAVRHKLEDLGYTVECLGGYKVKEVAEMLAVPAGRVRHWVATRLLLTKGGRITDSSFSKFLAKHPGKVPFETLPRDMQDWLVETGYPKQQQVLCRIDALKAELLASSEEQLL